LPRRGGRTVSDGDCAAAVRADVRFAWAAGPAAVLLDRDALGADVARFGRDAFAAVAASPSGAPCSVAADGAFRPPLLVRAVEALFAPSAAAVDRLRGARAFARSAGTAGPSAGAGMVAGSGTAGSVIGSR
jgi:hypothetical protein